MQNLLIRTISLLISIITKVVWSIYKYIYPLSRKINYIIYSNYIGAKLNTKNVSFLYPVSRIHNHRYIQIGEGTTFGRMAVITAWPQQTLSIHGIKIGKNCNFGDFINITSSNEINIGNDVLTGRWVTITDNSHGDTDYASLTIPPSKRPIVSKGPVLIDDDVWIGDKATILPNIKIGKGSIIAANSVVTRDIPPYSIAAGIPAKIISQRS